VLLPSLIKFTKQPALPLALLLLLLLALLLMASHRYYLRLPFYCDGSYSLLLVIASHCSLASYRSAPSPFLSIPTNKDSSFKTIRCSAKPEYFQSDRPDPARTHDSATCSCLMTCLIDLPYYQSEESLPPGPLFITKVEEGRHSESAGWERKSLSNNRSGRIPTKESDH